MNKYTAIDNFWNSFGIPAFDETTVKDKQPFPYITYSVKSDSIGNPVTLNASLWYKSYSWKEISEKTEEIAQRIVTMYPAAIQLDTGRLYLSQGAPFAQRMSDPEDDTIRRVFMTINAEFLTRW